MYPLEYEVRNENECEAGRELSRTEARWSPIETDFLTPSSLILDLLHFDRSTVTEEKSWKE